MAQQLRAVPDVLSHIGDQLLDQGESLLALQRACHGQLEDARSGWIGFSASALSTLLDQWATASTAHIAHFGQQSAGLHVAAAGFTELEQRNSASLR